MKAKSKAALFEAVELVLWNDWDPIGVNDIPAARGEYSSYVPSVVRLLEDGADVLKLSEHLHSIERVSMGISTYSDHRKGVAQKLVDALRKYR